MRAIKVAAATVGLSAALTGTAVGLAGPVSAAPGTQGCTQGSYPPANSTVALSRSRATVGMTMSFSARCFKPGEKVTATVYSTPQRVGEYTASATGDVSGSFTIPSNLKPGRHTLELAAATGTQSASFIVVPNAAAAGTGTNGSSSDSLAFTGSDAAKTAGAGLVLLLGGGALIVAAKRRKHANAAA